MQLLAKELNPGDKFLVLENGLFTSCLKTSDGKTYRLKDGSEISLFPTKKVELPRYEETGFRVATYKGRQVLVKRLTTKKEDVKQYCIKSYVPIETVIVRNPELQGLKEERREKKNRKELNGKLLRVLELLSEV